MSHYNLYDSLSLDAASDSAELTAEIDRKLAQISPDDEVARDELSTARKIFASHNRRKHYDEEIADSSGPEVNIARIKDIAELPDEPQSAQAVPASENSSSDDSASGWQQYAQQTSTTSEPVKRNTSLNMSEKQLTVDFSSKTFAVAPRRQRCQSIMWAVVWGLLLLMWIIAGIRGWLLANAASEADVFGEIVGALGGASPVEEKGNAFAASAARAVLVTPLLLLLGEFVWTIRKIMGNTEA
ncbi:hypothetical protein [Corynebacterium propinquum]|uniref:hypothetical protein n=1 Tax=Corynebacterium propinquum TaxID=43769 RepID=UPI0025436265|nr:hypothetical protein [Corynebacterium propinquum]MDK4252920.1 hypothetical protein [Corynebacterium propinquum]